MCLTLLFLIHLEKADIEGRLCTAAEVTFYFNSFIDSGGRTSYMKPNKNCNSTSWVPGCEPGWASSVPPDEKVDLQESQQLPSRNVDSKPCCPGFYCPYGITCMIRKCSCPLFSLFPLACSSRYFCFLFSLFEV